MKFDQPATTNPIDQLKVVGKPTDRIDGPLKTTGTAPYTYDRHDVIANPAVGFVVTSAVSKGRITSIDVSKALGLYSSTRKATDCVTFWPKSIVAL